MSWYSSRGRWPGRAWGTNVFSMPVAQRNSSGPGPGRRGCCVKPGYLIKIEGRVAQAGAEEIRRIGRIRRIDRIFASTPPLVQRHPQPSRVLHHFGQSAHDGVARRPGNRRATQSLQERRPRFRRNHEKSPLLENTTTKNKAAIDPSTRIFTSVTVENRRCLKRGGCAKKRD